MKHDAVTIHGMAVGGDGVGRSPDGRIVFVPGTATGDVVSVGITETKPRYLRARVESIITPSPWRIEPPCPAVSRGCGGCDWQHIGDQHREVALLGLVDDVLARQGRVENPSCSYGGGVDGWNYRTSLRLATLDARSAFRAAGSNDLVPVDECMVAAPLLVDLVSADWPAVKEVTLRCGSRTGERMAIVAPARPEELELPSDVIIVGRDELRAGRKVWIHEQAADRVWRISADSFFQSSPQAAELLVDTAERLAGDYLKSAGAVVDLYGGVGLLTGSLARAAPRSKWTLVESSASSVADAKANLNDLDVTVERSRVEQWTMPPCDVVIADPPRSGLGHAGADVIAAGHAGAVVLVSCDLGTLGRDVRLMTERGYRWQSSVVLDIFAQTSHAEVVTLLCR